jgi:hypothetical protein
MTRTGSMASRVPPAVTSTGAAEVGRAETALDGGHDGGGIGEASRADVAAGQAARLGPHDVHTPFGQRGEVVLDRGVLPHLGVHGRADHHRAPGWREGGGQQVVGPPGA